MKQTYSPRGNNEPLESYLDFKANKFSKCESIIEQSISDINSSSLKNEDKKLLLFQLKNKIEFQLIN